MAAALLQGGSAEACSCIQGLVAETSLEVRPRRRVIHRDEHLWLRPKTPANLGLFLGSTRLAVRLTQLAGWYELAPLAPLPARSRLSIKSEAAGSWETMAEIETDGQLAGKLAAGGRLTSIEARDGSIFDTCASGEPSASLEFSTFAGGDPPGGVPYLFWVGPAPLDTSRPPDHVDFIAGPSHRLMGSTPCAPSTYWLPVGEQEIRLAAAPVSPDGTRGEVSEVTFAMALDQKSWEKKVDDCRALERAQQDQSVRLLQRDAERPGSLAASARVAAMASGAGAVLGALAAILSLVLKRTRWYLWMAPALLCGLAAAGAEVLRGRAFAELEAVMARVSASREKPSECSGRYPRRPREAPRRQ